MEMRVLWSRRRVAESPGATSSCHSTLPENGGCDIRKSPTIMSTPLAWLVLNTKTKTYSDLRTPCASIPLSTYGMVELSNHPHTHTEGGTRCARKQEARNSGQTPRATLMKPCQSTEKWSEWPDTFHTSVRGS